MFNIEYGKIQDRQYILKLQIRDPQIFQKLRTLFKILGARRMTWSKFHTKAPQMFNVTLQNLVTQVTCHLGFVQLYFIYW